MRLRRTINSVIAPALTALVMLSGCSSPVPGTPTAQDWTDSPVFDALRSIPANADSKFEIGLVNGRALNALNRHSDDPLPTAASRSGQRPPADYAWTRYSIAGSGCGLLDSQYQTTTGWRIGPPGDMLTVYLGEPGTDQMVSACQGDVDLAAFGDRATARDRGGVNGVEIDGIWLGRTRDLTFQFGADVPDALASAMLAGDTGDGVLTDDPAVLAVLTANPRAAAVEMGTIFVGTAGRFGDDTMQTLLADAESAQGQRLPTPTFGGYGWTQDQGLSGTGAFVTYYGSESDADAAGAVLSAIWPKAGDTPFAKARTSVDGAAVITRLTGIAPNDFDLRNLNLAKYPGYGAKE